MSEVWDGKNTIVKYLCERNLYTIVKDSVNIITAGPSAGKSSTIRELSARGYRTLPEAARILFDQAISEGRDPAAVRKDDDFHEQVETIDRQIERHITDGQTVFLDRGLGDNIAYRRRFGNNDHDAILRLHQECEERYDNVFILERIDFEDDEVRVEDEEEARKTHEAIQQAYFDMGYNLIEIPIMPVDERVDMIEREIEHPNPIH